MSMFKVICKTVFKIASFTYLEYYIYILQKLITTEVNLENHILSTGDQIPFIFYRSIFPFRNLKMQNKKFFY